MNRKNGNKVNVDHNLVATSKALIVKRRKIKMCEWDRKRRGKGRPDDRKGGKLTRASAIKVTEKYVDV